MSIFAAFVYNSHVNSYLLSKENEAVPKACVSHLPETVKNYFFS
jgi:hypothetical protein